VTYPLTHGNHATELFKHRTVEKSAAFLLPYLKKEFHLLDCGCGPGSITNGFLRYLPEGKVTGIDIDKQAIAWAHNHYPHAEFLKADVHDLPFPDNTFDVLYSHTMLWTLPNPHAALVEMKRVTKPEGLIACAEVSRRDLKALPSNPLLEKAFQLQNLGLEAVSAHPYLGEELPSLLKKLDLTPLYIDQKIKYFNQKDELNSFVTYLTKNWDTAPWAKKLLLLDYLKEEEIPPLLAAFGAWAKRPDATIQAGVGEAIGRLPRLI